MTDDYGPPVQDLAARTMQAIETITHLAVDTTIPFEINDVVDAVERGLPAGYPAPTTGDVTRRDLIGQMAQDILGGEFSGTVNSEDTP